MLKKIRDKWDKLEVAVTSMWKLRRNTCTEFHKLDCGPLTSWQVLQTEIEELMPRHTFSEEHSHSYISTKETLFQSCFFLQVFFPFCSSFSRFEAWKKHIRLRKTADSERFSVSRLAVARAKQILVPALTFSLFVKRLERQRIKTIHFLCTVNTAGMIKRNMSRPTLNCV